MVRDGGRGVRTRRPGGSQGLPGVERAPRPGRPAGLTTVPRVRVQEAVRRRPRESGDHARLWTTTSARHPLDTRLGRERVRPLLPALGVRWRRLRHRHPKAKAEAQAVLQAARQAGLEAWPEEWEWIVVDEATLRRHPTLTAQWCLVDDVPEVPTRDDHTRCTSMGPSPR